MTDRAREHDARSKIWQYSGSGSMDAVWIRYAEEMAVRRDIPVYEALELILPEVKPSTGPWYWERVCIVCGGEAEWWRTATMFVYYGFCETHARSESDFDPDGHSTIWNRPLFRS